MKTNSLNRFEPPPEILGPSLHLFYLWLVWVYLAENTNYLQGFSGIGAGVLIWVVVVGGWVVVTGAGVVVCTTENNIYLG